MTGLEISSTDIRLGLEGAAIQHPQFEAEIERTLAVEGSTQKIRQVLTKLDENASTLTRRIEVLERRVEVLEQPNWLERVWQRVKEFIYGGKR